MAPSVHRPVRGTLLSTYCKCAITSVRLPSGRSRRVTILGRTPVFAGLSRRLLSRLAVQLFEKAYAPGEAVFSEGDPGKGLFIVGFREPSAPIEDEVDGQRVAASDADGGPVVVRLDDR